MFVWYNLDLSLLLQLLTGLNEDTDDGDSDNITKDEPGSDEGECHTDNTEEGSVQLPKSSLCDNNSTDIDEHCTANPASDIVGSDARVSEQLK